MFGLFSKPKLQHARFGEMIFRRGYWEVEADYLGYRNVLLRLPGSRDGIGEQADVLCGELERRYPLITERIAQVLFKESYQPVRRAIRKGDYPGDPGGIPRLKSVDDVWSNLRLASVDFGVEFDKNIIELGYGADWEIEHRLGIGIKDWRFEYFNGSV